MKIVSSTRPVERDAVLAGCRGRMLRDARTFRPDAADPSQERSRPILDDAYQDLSSKAGRRAQALGPCAGRQRCCGVDARLRRSMPGDRKPHQDHGTKTTAPRQRHQDHIDSRPKLCLSATLATLTGVGMVPNGRVLAWCRTSMSPGRATEKQSCSWMRNGTRLPSDSRRAAALIQRTSKLVNSARLQTHDGYRLISFTSAAWDRVARCQHAASRKATEPAQAIPLVAPRNAAPARSGPSEEVSGSRLP